jgi:hypothetical protein
MSGRRPIDVKRDASITLEIGGDDKSPAKEFLSTAGGLYVIKETGVFKIQLADDIDPGRTNPNVPNLSQQVLTEGYSSEVVARVLLTAKSLFDENNATVKPFVAELFEQCLVLTRQILELDTMTGELAEEIRRKEENFAAKAASPNAFSLPSIPGIETKVQNILFKADKARDTLIGMFRLQFLPSESGKVKLDALEKAIEGALRTEPQLIEAWQEISKYLALVRNMRNACEHPKENYRVALTDFSMQPSGEVNPPLVAIQHPDTPIRTLPLTEFVEFVRQTMLAHAENALAFMRIVRLLANNPFGESVAEFPESERRHKFVRYYRAINVGGQLRILG